MHDAFCMLRLCLFDAFFLGMLDSERRGVWWIEVGGEGQWGEGLGFRV